MGLWGDIKNFAGDVKDEVVDFFDGPDGGGNNKAPVIGTGAANPVTGRLYASRPAPGTYLCQRTFSPRISAATPSDAKTRGHSQTPGGTNPQAEPRRTWPNTSPRARLGRRCRGVRVRR